MATTKLDRLNMLHAALLECKKESVKDADEWQVYDDMMKRVNSLITEEHRRLGHMAVYSIVDGQADAELYTGTQEQCRIYVGIFLEKHPEMKGNIIIANI